MDVLNTAQEASPIEASTPVHLEYKQLQGPTQKCACGTIASTTAPTIMFSERALPGTPYRVRGGRTSTHA